MSKSKPTRAGGAIYKLSALPDEPTDSGSEGSGATPRGRRLAVDISRREGRWA